MTEKKLSVELQLKQLDIVCEGMREEPESKHRELELRNIQTLIRYALYLVSQNEAYAKELLDKEEPRIRLLVENPNSPESYDQYS